MPVLSLKDLVQNMIFRLFLALLLTLFTLQGRGQSYTITPQIFDFNTVELWKNDTAVFTLKNTSQSPFIFLPIRYADEVLLILPEGKIEVGESVRIKLVYFTQTKGNFKKSIPVYISTSSTPIELTIKGKINDFHKDAMLNCPSFDETKPQTVAEHSIIISVQDGITGKGLSGFEMELKNNLFYQAIAKSGRDRVRFGPIPPSLYMVAVYLVGYEPKNEEIAVNTTTKKHIIKLYPKVDTTQDWILTDHLQGDTAIEIKHTIKKDIDIEKLRQKFNDQFKNKQIIEKDVLIVKEETSDTLQKQKVETHLRLLPDFNQDGTLTKEKYASNNLVFLIDVSSSMERPEKLPYLKKSIKNSVSVLRKEDLVTIIIYSSNVKVVLQGEPGDHKEKINTVIDQLTAKGLSHGSEGLNMAYANAKINFIPKGNNQIILVSDGLFNSQDFSASEIYKLAKWNAENENIKTSAIGFGKNKEAINFMKTLSENGSGNFIQIVNETDSVLVNEIMANSRRF